MKDFSAVYAARQLELAQSDFDARDKEAIVRFLNNLQARGVKENRLCKYSEKFKGIKPFLSKPLVDLSGVEVDNLLIAVNKNSKWTAWTKHDYQLALKKFYRFTDGNDERAGRIKVITPLPELVDESAALTSEDVAALELACRNVRDKAIVRFLFETGCRMAEFIALKVGSVEDHGEFLRFKVTGTKNRYANRAVMVDNQDAITLFHEFMQSHPQRANPQAALWIEPTHGQPIEERNLNELLRYRAKVAGLAKAVNPHSFRKGSVTHYRKRGLSNASLETRFGWRKGSEMLMVYDRSGEQALLEDMRRTKPKTEQETQELAVKDIEALLRDNPQALSGIARIIINAGIAPQFLRAVEPLRALRKNVQRLGQDLKQIPKAPRKAKNIRSK